MADVLDLDNEVSELEAVEQQDAIAAQEAPTPQPAEDLPEEFKGMSLKELANIAKHARREMGRQANELGEVRKLADELLKSTLQPKIVAEPPKEIDFFSDPQAMVRQMVETNPAVLEARNMALQVKRAQALQQMTVKHPDFATLVRDADFQRWVGASTFRSELLQKADDYDASAADELFSTFKQLKAVQTKQESASDKTARNQAMAAAAVDTGGSGEVSRKVYRRADLIRLKIRDPGKYESMQPEIMAAYQEGRIK